MLKVFFTPTRSHNHAQRHPGHAQRHPGTNTSTGADAHETIWQQLLEKTAIVSFVRPCLLVMAPKASKRSLRGRAVSGDHAEQLETPSSSRGSVSVAADYSSSVRNKVPPTTERRTNVGHWRPILPRSAPACSASKGWERRLVFRIQRRRHTIDAHIAARMAPRSVGLETICGTNCSKEVPRNEMRYVKKRKSAPGFSFVEAPKQETQSACVAKTTVQVLYEDNKQYLGTPRQKR